MRLRADELPAQLGSSSDWSALPRPKARRAANVYRREDQAHLFVAREGHAFLFRSEPLEGESAEFWIRMLGTVVLMRSER